MPAAFVLINSDINNEFDVLKELKKVEGVEHAYALYGVYDIIARVSSESVDELKQIITWKIKKLAGIRATLTVMINESDAPLSSQVSLSAALPMIIHV